MKKIIKQTIYKTLVTASDQYIIHDHTIDYLQPKRYQWKIKNEFYDYCMLFICINSSVITIYDHKKYHTKSLFTLKLVKEQFFLYDFKIIDIDGNSQYTYVYYKVLKYGEEIESYFILEHLKEIIYINNQQESYELLIEAYYVGLDHI